MVTRIIFGALTFIVAILSVIAGKMALGMVISLIMIASLIEMFKTNGLLKENPLVANISIVFAIALAISSVAGIYYETFGFDTFSKSLMALICFYIISISITTVLRFEKTDFNLVMSSFFSTVYITVMYMHILLVRHLVGGEALVWVLLLSAWACDTLAYFSGRFLGKTPLIPKVSAKKTVEGAVGGTLGSVIVMIIFGLGCKKMGYSVNMSALVLLTFISAVVSQFGDLIASCIKRHYNAKDYGSVLPGHGGFLDRFDSVLFVAPVVYYVCLLVNVIS